MTLDVYRGRKTTMQQQQQIKHRPAEKQLSNGVILVFHKQSLAHIQQEAIYCDNDKPLFKLEVPRKMGAFRNFRILLQLM